VARCGSRGTVARSRHVRRIGALSPAGLLRAVQRDQSFYLSLGWGVALTAIPIFRQRGFRHLAPLFYGGVAYSMGAFTGYMGWLTVIPGVVDAHEIWHLAVLAGALLHWWFVWIVVGEDVADAAPSPSRRPPGRGSRRRP
jgi:hypothetical protein